MRFRLFLVVLLGVLGITLTSIYAEEIIGNLDISGTTTTDTINEHTGAAGVTIDSVLVKDNTVKSSLFKVSDGTNTITIDDPGALGGDKTLYLPNANDTLLGKETTDTVGNKSFKDSTNKFVDETVTTKALEFSLGGGTAAKTMTIVSSPTDNRSLTLPDISDTLVSKTTTDTMTNKTLNAGTVGGPSNGGTDGFLLFKDQSDDPSAADGDDVKLFAKDKKVYKTDSTGVAVEVGAGAGGTGEKNYIGNPSGASDTTGWAESTNGKMDITRTITDNDLPRDATTGTGLQIVATADEAAGEYVKYAFALDDVDVGTQSKISFAVKPLAGYTASDFEVYIRDVTNATTITPTVYQIADADYTFYAEYATTTSQSYELRIQGKTGIVEGATVGLVISDVIVGPGQLVVGPVVSGWTAFTPVLKFGSTTHTPTVAYGHWKRTGNTCEFIAYIQMGGVANAADLMYLMSPFTIDTAIASASGGITWGMATLYDTTLTKNYSGGIVIADSTKFQINRMDDSGAVIDQWRGLTTPIGEAFDNGDYLRFRVSGLPIAEWSTNAYYGAESVEFSSNSNSNAATADDTTSFVYGQSGSLLISATPAGIGITRTVRFQRKIQPSDLIILEISNDRNYWTTVPADPASPGGIDSMRYDGTNYIGAGGLLVSTNGTDVQLRFGKYRSGVTAAWAGTGYWRVKKVSSPGLAGHKLASNTEYGIIKLPAKTNYAIGYTGNGFGSSDIKVRRFTNSMTSGSDITYTGSAAAGVTFTINTEGLYAVSYSDRSSVPADIGITINSTAAPQGLAPAALICMSDISIADSWTNCSGTAYLSVGDVIRATSSAGGTFTSSDSAQLRIVRIY